MITPCVKHTPDTHAILAGMRNKENLREWYQRRKQARPDGVCSRYPGCISQTDGVHKLCAKHLAISLTNKARKKSQPKEVGECQVWSCQRPARTGMSRCERCATNEARASFGPVCKQRRAERRQEVKAEVIGAYGGKCACCGNAGMAFLTIDHVGRYNGIGPKTGNPLYLWLKVKSYPGGFRVLCMSCNFALGKFGYCPHSNLVQPLPDVPVQERTLKNRSYQQARNLEHKLAAFSAYGSVCRCCGESHHECLSIDHLHGDGGAHRKDLNGMPVYWWLCRNNFPPGFQVLCLNCNFSKRIYGVCWHQLDGRTPLEILKGGA